MPSSFSPSWLCWTINFKEAGPWPEVLPAWHFLDISTKISLNCPLPLFWNFIEASNSSRKAQCWEMSASLTAPMHLLELRPPRRWVLGTVTHKKEGCHSVLQALQALCQCQHFHPAGPNLSCTHCDDFVFYEYRLIDWGSEAICINIVTICYKNGKGILGGFPSPETFSGNVASAYPGRDIFIAKPPEYLQRPRGRMQSLHRSAVVFCLLISFNRHFSIS